LGGKKDINTHSPIKVGKKEPQTAESPRARKEGGRGKEVFRI